MTANKFRVKQLGLYEISCSAGNLSKSGLSISDTYLYEQQTGRKITKRSFFYEIKPVFSFQHQIISCNIIVFQNIIGAGFGIDL